MIPETMSILIVTDSASTVVNTYTIEMTANIAGRKRRKKRKKSAGEKRSGSGIHFYNC